MEKLKKDQLVSRFHDIIDTREDDIKNLRIEIVGVGSGGAYVAFLLAKMGFENIKVWDFDKVEEANVGYQLYGANHVGMNKAEALQQIIKEQVGLEIEVEPNEAKPEDVSADIMVLGVDSMDARKEFAENADYRWAVDGRMGGEEVNIYTWNEFELEKYMSTWFPSSEAEPEGCGGKAIAYTCFLDAGIMATMIKRIAKEEEVKFEVNLQVNNLKIF